MLHPSDTSMNSYDNTLLEDYTYLQLSLQAEQVIPVPCDECWSFVGEVNGFERTTRAYKRKEFD